MSAEKKAAARGRLEADAVEILTRKTRELEDECERLRTECERAAGSFKLAWQAERTAHQRDLEGAAAAKALADDAQRRLNSELSAALETQQRDARRSLASVVRDVDAILQGLSAATDRDPQQRCTRNGAGTLSA